MSAPPFQQLVQTHCPREGRNESPQPELTFFRASVPTTFQKRQTFGVTLTIVSQGSKVARFSDRELVYDPEHFLVVTGDTVFDAVTNASADHPYLAVAIQLPADIVAKTLVHFAETGAQSGGTPVDAYLAEVDTPLLDVVTRLIRCLDDPAERQVLFPLAMEELVFRLLRSEAASTIRSTIQSGDGQRLQKAFDYLRAHFKEPVSVADAASVMGMSPSRFAHWFRSFARVSPMRFVKQLRQQESRILLVEKGLRVEEVAFAVGYRGTSHFHRDFKAYFGTSPSEYLRRLFVPG